MKMLSQTKIILVEQWLKFQLFAGNIRILYIHSYQWVGSSSHVCPVGFTAMQVNTWGMGTISSLVLKTLDAYVLIMRTISVHSKPRIKPSGFHSD